MWAVLLTAAMAASAEPSSAPNVVFLSVDTLRADRLGCYGCELEISPNLDRLAESSLLFEDCLCEVPITNPSFGAMLSSRYPRMTGTVRNGLPMPGDVPLVTEFFKAAGYHTFCVQSNWTLKSNLSGLDRGFDVYEDAFEKKRWGFLKSERIAKDVTDTALELLADRDPARPLFCWVHYSDPHAPYRFHRKFNPGGKRLRKYDKEGQVRARYDSEVAYTDHHIGRLLEALPNENTYVLFVADHGESLYEHDYLGHGRRVYQTGLHIPLLIHGPGIEPGRTSAPARGVDAGPTLLGLAGLGAAPGMMGLDLLAGDVPPDRVRVVETYGGAVPKIPGARAMMAGRPPMRQGVVSNGSKLILNGRQTELFQLIDDPMEEEELSGELPARVEELRQLVAEWDGQIPRGHSEGAELSEDDIEALEAGGYL